MTLPCKVPVLLMRCVEVKCLHRHRAHRGFNRHTSYPARLFVVVIYLDEAPPRSDWTTGYPGIPPLPSLIRANPKYEKMLGAIWFVIPSERENLATGLSTQRGQACQILFVPVACSHPKLAVLVDGGAFIREPLTEDERIGHNGPYGPMGRRQRPSRSSYRA